MLHGELWGSVSDPCCSSLSNGHGTPRAAAGLSLPAACPWGETLATSQLQVMTAFSAVLHVVRYFFLLLPTHTYMFL